MVEKIQSEARDVFSAQDFYDETSAICWAPPRQDDEVLPLSTVFSL